MGNTEGAAVEGAEGLITAVEDIAADAVVAESFARSSGREDETNHSQEADLLGNQRKLKK